MNKEKLILVIDQMADAMESQKEYLTELDNSIGDGDHGINMARGFGEVNKKRDALLKMEAGDMIKNLGMILVATVGGASGPLYGTAFMKAGTYLKGKEDITFDDFLESFQCAIDGVMARGKAVEGEKTMLDAMMPAKRAMEKEWKITGDVKKSLEAGIAAAKAGVEFTKRIAATKGRASYLGERSIGHQDPGATSFTFLLEAIASRI
ncbi:MULTISPECIES: dihydroxyacetone kinase subunit DhaL [Lacrimispora]|jgi:dihydroxyacetone kinase-like protein|uniref:dihydroxyacetone kinase subunit DhaL n=1 Tax=Lacrimispora TaxID=2719231 RepID=UPI000BE2E848|nr:dihydroxyacetone kinase subunit DhaL [Lacrimispora amygdalina]MDK2968657.1 phosphoenolpyruvate---glycerone phosphotransferase subunit DhaL [Lacrimispora sp.]